MRKTIPRFLNTHRYQRKETEAVHRTSPYHANDEQEFVTSIKTEIDENFAEINQSHMYYAKKSLRKILRIINKYCRYSNVTETEVALRIHFCSALKESGISIRRDKMISKIYQAQLGKIKTLVASLHEDLQYDYERELKELE